MHFTRRTMLAMSGATALTAATGGLARASGWQPDKPIDFVIMAGPGGGADKMARFMQSVIEANSLSPRPLIPNNKPGGSGAEALVALKQAEDPNHTILVTLNSFFTTPIVNPGLEVDIMTFGPVGRMAEDTFLLWVHKDEGVATFEEYVTKATEMGSDWVMGGTGKDSEDNIITDYLNANFGLSMKYIPYKGGGEVAKQLAGKQITSSVNNPSEALGFFESGDLIPLVAFTDDRLDQFPDVPTLKELGTDWSYYMQRAVVGAPGMAPEALEFYETLFKACYDTAEWQEYMVTQSLTGDFISGDDLKAYWEVQYERHLGILKPA